MGFPGPDHTASRSCVKSLVNGGRRGGMAWRVITNSGDAGGAHPPRVAFGLVEAGSLSREAGSTGQRRGEEAMFSDDWRQRARQLSVAAGSVVFVLGLAGLGAPTAEAGSEGVPYVDIEKLCRASGPGYYYVPGTGKCLRIGAATAEAKTEPVVDVAKICKAFGARYSTIPGTETNASKHPGNRHLPQAERLCGGRGRFHRPPGGRLHGGQPTERHVPAEPRHFAFGLGPRH